MSILNPWPKDHPNYPIWKAGFDIGFPAGQNDGYNTALENVKEQVHKLQKRNVKIDKR